MIWMLATAAVGAGGVLFQLGAMSVWVAVLSMTLRAVAAACFVAIAAVIGRLVWCRVRHTHSGKARQ